jgi:SAM-dependent methyltransferase
MTLIPWRVRNFLSERFPLLYHLVVNAGVGGNSPKHWDLRLAQSWDAPDRHWPTKNELIASLTKPSDVVLDIGCGNGSMLRHLQGLGYRHLQGLEISGYAIKRLRGEGIEVHYGALSSIALPEASFDVVIASQILEHIIRRHRFLSEMRRILKPGGRALIFVPDDCLGPISEPEHVIKYNARSLRECLEPYFTIIRLDSMRDVNHPMSILFAHAAKAAS